MKQEYIALINKETWSLVEKPTHKSIIDCKWVFRIKKNPDGSVEKYKARLVAKGYLQRLGFDYFVTFSLVVKSTTIWIMSTLAVTNNCPLRHLDINNEFLNEVSTEEVFMSQPKGFV